MNAGYGLAVRWSLKDAPEGVARRLREYVVGTSIARFMFEDGLAFKVWRDRFRTQFEAVAATSPGSEIIGSAPIAIEDYEVVAIAEGPAGFRRGAGPGLDPHD